MELIKTLIALAFGLVGLICWIIVLIEAFKDEIWKGIVGILCGLYLLYYALFDFEHEHKWPIVILAFAGSAISAGIMRM